MLRNFFKTAVRSLIKQKIFTLINILGLAVSITACLLIVLYVKHELSYDKFNPKADCIFKMILERKYPNHATLYSIIPHSYAEACQRDLPEVQNTLRLSGPFNKVNVTYKAGPTEQKLFEENGVTFADTSFFSFFNVRLIKGDRKTALAQARQVIVTESTAKKYFGNEDPMGKVLNFFGAENQFKVVGVCEDFPENSHLRFSMVASLLTDPNFFNRENFTSFDSHTYLELKPGIDRKQVEAKLPKIVDTYASAEIERELQQSWADYKKAGNGYVYTLQPLTSIHLDPANIEFTIKPSGNIKYVYILSFIALLILIIACINFMNLATARSAERSREVGVRKVMGSLKNHLVTQFLVESILLSFVSTIVAVILSLVLLPAFKSLTQTQLNLTFAPDVIAGLLGFALLVGILAGLYPAFVLSSFNPVVVMKSNFSGAGRGTWLRNGLVVFQFMISIVLIVGTLIVGEQMQYMQNKKLGFDKSQVIMIERAWATEKSAEAFKEELKRLPGVEAIGGTNNALGSLDFFGMQFQPAGSNEILTVKTMVMDDDYTEAIGFTLSEGRSFSKNTQDSLSILLNEVAVKTIGLKDPVGQKLRHTEADDSGKLVTREFTVIGVTKDFHFQSLRDKITPLAILSNERFRGNNEYFAVRLKGGEIPTTIKQIENTWKKFVQQYPFQYTFLDEDMKTQYAEEQRSGKLFAVFSGLAIIIACVGLFGLSAYTASLRKKEIGIRKVLGASVGGVVTLLSKEFTKLVIIAFIIATPISWWMMSTWLQGFAYRTSLGVGVFILAGLVALLIAWLTVSYQSIKAAIANPVKSLRSE
jgi:putative ABC transport system permease protein